MDGPNNLKETVIARQAVNVTSDLDYQLGSSTVSVQFSGFESALHGVMRFEVAVGTEPGGEDVLPFTSASIVHMEQPDVVGHGKWNTYTESREIFGSYYSHLFNPNRQCLNLRLDKFFFFNISKFEYLG